MVSANELPILRSYHEQRSKISLCCTVYRGSSTIVGTQSRNWKHGCQDATIEQAPPSDGLGRRATPDTPTERSRADSRSHSKTLEPLRAAWNDNRSPLPQTRHGRASLSGCRYALVHGRRSQYPTGKYVVHRKHARGSRVAPAAGRISRNGTRQRRPARAVLRNGCRMSCPRARSVPGSCCETLVRPLLSSGCVGELLFSPIPSLDGGCSMWLSLTAVLPVPRRVPDIVNFAITIQQRIFRPFCSWLEERQIWQFIRQPHP